MLSNGNLWCWWRQRRQRRQLTRRVMISCAMCVSVCPRSRAHHNMSLWFRWIKIFVLIVHVIASHRIASHHIATTRNYTIAHLQSYISISFLFYSAINCRTKYEHLCERASYQYKRITRFHIDRYGGDTHIILFIFSHIHTHIHIYGHRIGLGSTPTTQ